MPSLNPRPTTFLATLGGQPQVVTFALDALLAADIPISEVIVLYLASTDGRIPQSLTILKSEFATGWYNGRPITFQPLPIRAGRALLRDIYDEGDANAAWEVVNQLLARLKSEWRTLHVCISGGRRILGLLTMSAAMLHFGHHDVLWHMYTPDEIQALAYGGALLHLPADSGFRLIRVPMMPWGSYFPALRDLTRPSLSNDSNDVLAGPRQLMDAVDRTRCQAVLAALTERQQEVLRAFAAGLSPQQVAEKLYISIKTVDTHKTAVLAECRNAWELPENGRLDYRFLADKFDGYF